VELLELTGTQHERFMKATCSLGLACVSACFLCGPVALADKLVFSNGPTISGTVLQTNGDEILLLTQYAAYNYSRSHLKEIEIEADHLNPDSNTNRFSDFKRTIRALSRQFWATNLTPIPATVIDKGILKNVPYSSFQCGENYEVNIYGDLDHPAGIEIGFYKILDDDKSRQSNCIQFMGKLFPQAADKALVQALALSKDRKVLDDLTFEITPPSDDDSYNGWWVSVYSEKQLNLARASDAEMKLISVAKVDAAKQSIVGDGSQWSSDQLKLSRPSIPTIMTLTNKDGDVISNAAVRIYEPGVSVIWEKGISGGVVKLVDLPDSFRDRFGYDPIKAKVADASEKEKRALRQRDLAAQAAQAAQQSKSGVPAPSSSGLSQLQDSGYGSGGNYSGGGSVYVRAYTRKDGTYVSGYTRRR